MSHWRTDDVDLAVLERLTDLLAACPAEYLAQLSMASGGRGWVSLTAAPWRAETAAARLPLLADAALGRAMLAGLGAQWTCRTVDLRLDLLAPVPNASEQLTCDAEFMGMGGAFGFCRAEIRLMDGTLVATACSQFMALELGAPLDLRPDLLQCDEPTFTPSDVVADGDGGHAFEYRLDSGMLNLQRMMHGGVQAALLVDALESSLTIHTSSTPRLLSLNVSYQRPVPLTPSGRVRLRTRLDRVGRNVAVGSAEIVSPDGKDQALAHATFARSAT